MSTQTAEQFLADLDNIADTFGEGLQDALQDCGDIVLIGIEDNFAASQTSRGESWPLRKDPRPTHPLLILSGDLKTAATLGNIFRTDNNELVIGVSKDTVEYAGVQHFGWPERNIAQRAYLGFSEEVVDACAEVLADAAVEAFMQE
jgi:phage gpG-like protein